jgi:hypothetical protein
MYRRTRDWGHRAAWLAVTVVDELPNDLRD